MYLPIYEFLGREERTFDEVKTYLMEDCEKSESTARSYLTSIRGNNPGLFIVDEEMGVMCIHPELVKDFENNLEMLFQWHLLDGRSNEINGLREKLDEALMENKELEEYFDSELADVTTSKNQLQNQVNDLQRQIQILEDKLLDQELCRKTLIVPSLTISPKHTGIYKDEQFPFEKRHPTINPDTLELDLYYEEILSDKKKGMELTKENVTKQKIARTLSDEILEPLMEKIAPIRKYKHHRNPLRHIMTVDQLLEMKDITNAEKMALYTYICRDYSKEKKELLDMGATYGANADFLIRLMEDKGVSAETKERIKDAIRLVYLRSEYDLRKRFADELLKGLWYIKANYGGKICKFQLVPIDEFSALHKRLIRQIKSYTNSYDD
jgi:hypothetical protein